MLILASAFCTFVMRDDAILPLAKADELGLRINQTIKASAQGLRAYIGADFPFFPTYGEVFRHGRNEAAFAAVTQLSIVAPSGIT